MKSKKSMGSSPGWVDAERRFLPSVRFGFGKHQASIVYYTNASGWVETAKGAGRHTVDSAPPLVGRPTSQHPTHQCRALASRRMPDTSRSHARLLRLLLDSLPQRAHVHHIRLRPRIKRGLREAPRLLPQHLPELTGSDPGLLLLFLARVLTHGRDQASVTTELGHHHPLVIREVSDGVENLLLVFRKLCPGSGADFGDGTTD